MKAGLYTDKPITGMSIPTDGVKYTYCLEDVPDFCSKCHRPLGWKIIESSSINNARVYYRFCPRCNI